MNNYSFPPVRRRLGFYPIVDSLSWLIKILDTRIQTVQLRIKNYTNEKKLEEDIKTAIMLSKYHSIKLFINDYWKLAIKYNAYGVHLGQDDINKADINAIRSSGIRLGLSTHNDLELKKSLSLSPSYISIGHIFQTNTKVMPYKPKGLNKLKHLVSKVPNVPTVAIGGINIKRVEKVLDCGVGGISVISAITKSENWRKTINDFLSIIKIWEINNVKNCK